MAKAEKTAAAEETEATTAPKKSKKMLFIIIAVVVVLIGGGVLAFLLLQHDPAEKDAKPEAVAEEHTQETATYVELGTFTANLVQEAGDRYLQTAISLKIATPKLEEKIKASRPEIMHRINMLLQSKRPSDLASVEGRETLAKEIKGQVEYVLGFRKVAPVISGEPTESIEGASAPAKTEERKIKSDLDEVLFTSFIIQ